jgi:hypothetical protein
LRGAPPPPPKEWFMYGNKQVNYLVYVSLETFVKRNYT